MKYVPYVLALGLLAFVFSHSTAQSHCETIVETAIETALDNCTDIRRNQACYGNISINVEAAPDVQELAFAQAGDLVAVTDLASMRLSSQVADTGEWGIADMLVEVLTNAGSVGAQVILFGEASIENTVEPAPAIVRVPITATINANIRSGPSTNFAVLGSVAAGEQLVATGRLDDGSWLRLQYDDGTAWIFTELVASQEDITTLDVVAQDSRLDAPRYGPMQAAIMATGVDDAPCEPAPESGVLLQTPEGVTELRFSLNEVEIVFQSTVYVQSQPDVEMIVNMLDGDAEITAFGETRFAPAGTRVRIPMGADSIAIGAPIGPEPYDDDEIMLVPVVLLMREVEPTASLTVAEIEDALASALPESGLWSIFWRANGSSGPFFCQSGFTTSWSENVSITYGGNGSITIVWTGLGNIGNDLVDFTVNPVGNGVYSDGARRLTVVDGNNFSVTFTGGCPVTATFSK